MGHYPTGVAVVTGVSTDGEPIGMVVGTFTSVSLEPPLVAFMPTATSGTYARMRDAGAYCVNVLAHDQLDLCRTMAVPRAGKFDDIAWSMSDLGAPALHDAVAHIHCHSERIIPAGDHFIVLCRVLQVQVTRPVTPLLFFQGGYGGFNPRGMTARGDAEVISAVRLAEVARPHVQRVARVLACEVAVLVAVSDRELITAVSAYGGSAEMSEPLGARVPLMPPLCEAYVARADRSVRQAWLGRSADQSEEAITRYRGRLTAIRECGYALSRLSDEETPTYADLKAALQEYAAGDLTPARERAVHSVISAASKFFETIDLEADETYNLGWIVVPVLGPDGDAVLCLQTAQLQQGVSGRQVLQWVGTLQRAAAAVSQELHDERRERYTDYRLLLTERGDWW